MPELILIRGIPGSGKTTLAKTKYPNHTLCEADQFFTNVNGNYNYDSTKIKEAHEYCYRKAKNALKSGHNVVVANTFTRIWEMKKYLNLPYPKQVITATGNYDNVHNVPPEVV